MMRSLVVALALWLLALGSCSAAEDGPGHPFDDDLISHLAGEWDVVRSMGSRHQKDTARAAWVLEHHFLHVHMKDVAVPAKYEADVYIGYSNADQRYIIHWLDVWGGRYSGRGKGARSGQSIEFRFDDDSEPFFNTFTYDAASDTWSMKLENGSKEGSRKLFALERWTRSR